MFKYYVACTFEFDLTDILVTILLLRIFLVKFDGKTPEDTAS